MTDTPAPFVKPVYLLVMTATIVPAPDAVVRRSSPSVRLEDYKRALRFWLRYPHPAAERILFLENSGSDLSELRAIAADENPWSRKVEFLSLPASKIPPGSNYGYAEMQLLDDGLALSSLRPATTHLLKTTGRLTFRTLGRALDHAEMAARAGSFPFELMVECRKISFLSRRFDARVQLFVCSHAFYDRVLRNSNREMNSTDVRLLEHLIFRKVIPFKGRPGYFLRYPCNIDPQGYSGCMDRRYDSARSSVRRRIRAVLRVVAPGYWF